MREIKFREAINYTAETPEGGGWMREHYVSTLKPWHKNQGYIMRKVFNHIYANKRGYVPEHRLVMERELGRFLNPRVELVHHIDGDRSNNILSNLKLTSPIEHPRGHVGERNHLGQTVATEPIFQELKFRLLNKNTGECRPYTLTELIGTTYRRGQFSFRGRFTGLKDKNGVEIYEGDILADDDILGVVTYNQTPGCIYAGSYSIVGNDGYATDWDGVEPENWHDFEVAGNIYENPELLEDNKGR